MMVKFLGLHIYRELRWKEQMATVLERTGLAGAMWEDCKTIRGSIRATYALAVPVGGETMDVIWGRCVLRTSTMEHIFQSQQRWMCSTQQASLNSEKSSNTHHQQDAHLTHGHARHPCQPSAIPPSSQQSPVPSGTTSSNTPHHTSITQLSKTSSQLIHQKTPHTTT